MSKPNRREAGLHAPKAGAKWRKAGLLAVIVLPWLLLFALVFRSERVIAYLKPEKQRLHFGEAGPWGRLHAVHFELKAPEKVTLDLCRTNLPAWFFGSTTTKEQLGAFFSTAGCTAQQTAELLSLAHAATNGWVVNP